MTSKIEELKEEVKTVYQTTSGDGFIKWLDKAYAIGREEGIKIGIEKAVGKMKQLRDKEFPLGERMWCGICAKRLFNQLKSSLTSDELLKK